MARLDPDAVYELLAGGPPQGLQPSEIALALGLDRGRATEVRDLLLKMVRDGAVQRAGRRYQARPDVAPPELSASSGRLQVTPRGRGFVDIGEAFEDVVVDFDDLGPAIDGDVVEVETWEHRRRQHGRVVRVVERGRLRLTGTLRGPPWRLEADDPRLPSPVEVESTEGDASGAIEHGAHVGDAVLARITRYPKRAGDGIGVQITLRLGDPGDLLTEVAKVIVGEGVEEPFPPRIDATGFPAAPTDADRVDRVDLRDRPFVTIDPKTARDFDDAVSLEPGPDGSTRVWVAVADVSHYVAEGSEIDREARRRGCSLYLPDRAIPMLPEALSSNICSLVPERDRLAMVVRLDVQADGRVSDSDCMAAVIHSRGRLDYGGVAAALENDFRGRRAAYREHIEMLTALSRVAKALNLRRIKRGSLELDLPEAQVELDEDDPRRVRDIVSSRASAPLKRAYNLVEELMLAANEAVARMFVRADQPTLWRVHALPNHDNLRQLATWLAGYGVRTDLAELTKRRGVADVLRRLANHPAGPSLSYLVLRTLKQAIYHVDNVGHFGLGSEAYLHFTSPIRRYPDLHVHRLIKRLLRDSGRPAGGGDKVSQVGRDALARIAHESSTLERRALDIERQIQSLYAASLMRDRIGDEHEGTVVGLTRFGVFFNLGQPYVDGLVKLEHLDERYQLDNERMRLFGKGGGRMISLGDRALLQVAGANVARRQIDLELLEWRARQPLVGDPPPRDSRPTPERGKRKPSARERTRKEPTRRRRQKRRH